MVMLLHQVDINADFVHNLNVDLLKAIGESCLVHPLLHWVKVEGQRLVLSSDWTPQIQQLAQRILLEAGERDCLFVKLLHVLVKPLTVVRH